MTKRVYEYAKEHDLTSKALLTMAETNGLEFGSHMSSITDDQEKQLNKIISNKNTKKIENKEKASQQASNKETKTSSNETNAIKQSL